MVVVVVTMMMAIMMVIAVMVVMVVMMAAIVSVQNESCRHLCAKRHTGVDPLVSDIGFCLQLKFEIAQESSPAISS